jgi:23S rRNA pseudouridine1911/1915/1917 synthase
VTGGAGRRRGADEDGSPGPDDDGSDHEPYLSEVVPPSLAGERLDRAVAMLADCSRAEAAEAIGSGRATVAGRVVTKVSHRLEEGDELVVLGDPHRIPAAVTADPEVEFAVLHEDDDVIVIDKPAGLVVHPGPGHTGSTLVHGLLARYPELSPDDGDAVGGADRPGLVHRLDRGTSGLLVVARNPRAHADLVEQLSSHSVGRVYTALAWRHPAHPHGVIDAPVGRSRRDPLRMTVAADGRPARTHYDVDRLYHDPVEVALLTCRLETGRTHQIRVHLSSIGHPVVGDPLYGGARSSFPVPRPFLHARRLEFAHPGTGEEVAFESPLPADLQAVLARLS